MRKILFFLPIAFAVSVSSSLISCNDAKTERVASGEVSHDSLVKRGAYMVSIMGCDDCHSPKVMGPHGPEVDASKRLSGYPAQMPLAPINQEALKSWVLFHPTETAAVGPWGASFSANLTSSASGIGEWTEERFLLCIREGKSKGLPGGRTLLPPMPWQEISRATDEDLKAIFAFLKSTKPVDNVVPQPIAPDQLAKVGK